MKDTTPILATGSRVDAVTAEVIRNAVISITREMKVNLQRTAYSPVIYEAEDFTVGLFDAEGNTISIGLGLPMFIRGLSDAIKAKLAHWGPDGMEPGDVLLTNDSYVMGSHLNHMIFSVPIFHEGELIAFSSSMAHWPDVGGALGGFTTDIYSEGVMYPFMKIYKAGEEDRELTSIIRTNVRLPERAMGDFRAQIASIRTGERRLAALLKRYGNEAFRESVRLIFDQSERLARAAVREIPDGDYAAEAFMDDDGISVGRHVPIRVEIVVRDDEMTIDLSGCGAQVAGFFNSGPTAGRSACQVAFKCLTTPTLWPINDGSFRPVKVVLPPGRVVSATRPAAMRWWMAYPMTVVDTIFRAVAQAKAGISIAGHHASLGTGGAFGFIDSKTGLPYLPGSGVTGGGGGVHGGWGAKLGEDGVSATICINDGDTHNAPVEATEAKSPSLTIRRALIPDSGGPGRWRGGLGAVGESRILVAAMYQSQIERTQCAPWGLFGGLDARPNRVGVTRADGTVQHFPTGKVRPLRLEAQDGFMTEMGGGGGFGDPLDRPEDLVLEDVRLGYVSPEAAERDYGVVTEANGRHPVLDRAATVELRSRRRRAREEAVPGPKAGTHELHSSRNGESS